MGIFIIGFVIGVFMGVVLMAIVAAGHNRGEI